MTDLIPTHHPTPAQDYQAQDYQAATAYLASLKSAVGRRGMLSQLRKVARILGAPDIDAVNWATLNPANVRAILSALSTQNLAPASIATALLQWGHAFVSVETQLGGEGAGVLAVASMGPRFCKRGNDDLALRFARDEDASMGPRFCKRGNSDERLEYLSLARASMGLRFCKRGNQRWLFLTGTPVLLQWGHAFVSVETGKDGFASRNRDLASMGPRFCKRGNGRGSGALHAVARASMGPRFCKRGNQSSRTTKPPQSSLQWGHAFVSVETWKAMMNWLPSLSF